MTPRPSPETAVFRLVADITPRGDQPRAIEQLVAGVERGERFQTLLGVTGSGKTFTMANVIARVGRPALVIAHNKTLAAQLYGELRDLFPDHAVEFFVSYFDYYQPEAYLPASDTYIEKETIVNDEIERMRHSATRSLHTRDDVVVVASVSCIYGLGGRRAYADLAVAVRAGEDYGRERLLHKLVEAHYLRSEPELGRGTFRVRGDTVEVCPAHERELAWRIEFFGDRVELISEIDPLRGGPPRPVASIVIHPASHFAAGGTALRDAAAAIREELRVRRAELEAAGNRVAAERLETRTLRDLEMLEQLGSCPGIENYSRHLAGRSAGEAPPCLLDHFPTEFLVFLDESHQTVPQLAGMYHADRSRKQTLVDHGFRLPSALDNRPLQLHEFEARVPQVVFVSATPAAFELGRSQGRVVEQIIRPTGLLDPEVELRPASSQLDDLLAEIRARAAAGERVLVTCLTKRAAEDLADYYVEVGVRCRYLHSDVETLERVRIVRDLRLGAFDVLIGINLIREGLDIPECSLVGILDADKEGFLRSSVALLQTIGRAARHLHGKAILYADTVTGSIRTAVEETNRRRDIQREYNEAHGITPSAVRRAVLDLSGRLFDAAPHALPLSVEAKGDLLGADEIAALVREHAAAMQRAAGELDFETAAWLRDRLALLRDMELGLKLPARALLDAVPRQARRARRRTGERYWARAR